MCMSAALWAGLDRVVFGATIVDANRHCNQIHIPATEVNARSDMKCVVVGPVVRDQCYALFTLSLIHISSAFPEVTIVAALSYWLSGSRVTSRPSAL